MYHFFCGCKYDLLVTYDLLVLRHNPKIGGNNPLQPKLRIVVKMKYLLFLSFPIDFVQQVSWGMPLSIFFKCLHTFQNPESFKRRHTSGPYAKNSDSPGLGWSSRHCIFKSSSKFLI